MKSTAVTSLTQDGFLGCLFEPSPASARCLIVLIGDESDDFMNTACARWLTDRTGCAALCLGVNQDPNEAPGLHRWPLEHVESAVNWLHRRGFEKIGLLGMSMQASLALTAASLLPEVSLVIALAPNDFVPWGFYQGKLGKDSKAEWPSGTSAFTWRGRELPYQPAGLEKEDYWQLFCQEKKQYHEMHSITLFNRSEEEEPIDERCFIPVENIRGSLILVGSEDDSMWDSVRYIHRMEQRLRAKGFPYPLEMFLYPVGTHLLVPETMMRRAVPLVGDLIPALFASGRANLRECRQARMDLERQLTAALARWE